jgi:uncharacterized protein (DUF2235 family)
VLVEDLVVVAASAGVRREGVGHCTRREMRMVDVCRESLAVDICEGMRRVEREVGVASSLVSNLLALASVSWQSLTNG